MRPSCHKNVIQWVLLATRREVGMHNGRGSAGFFLAMVLFLLAGPLAERTGVAVWFAASGVPIFLAGLLIWVPAGVRRLRTA